MTGKNVQSGTGVFHLVFCGSVNHSLLCYPPEELHTPTRMKGAKGKGREYFGRLFFIDTEEVMTNNYFPKRTKCIVLQLVKAYPLLWFTEDEYGGWVRLNNFLSINNLLLQGGSGAPSKPSAAKQAVSELVQSCILAGADPSISDFYRSPLLFSDLLVLLEEKGLAKPSPPPLAGQHRPVCDAAERSLGNEYRDEVLKSLKNRYLHKFKG